MYIWIEPMQNKGQEKAVMAGSKPKGTKESLWRQVSAQEPASPRNTAGTPMSQPPVLPSTDVCAAEQGGIRKKPSLKGKHFKRHHERRIYQSFPRANNTCAAQSASLTVPRTELAGSCLCPRFSRTCSRKPCRRLCLEIVYQSSRGADEVLIFLHQSYKLLSPLIVSMETMHWACMGILKNF